MKRDENFLCLDIDVKSGRTFINFLTFKKIHGHMIMRLG